MQFTTFIRKPFMVEAIKITEENIEEVAKLIGTLRKKQDGTKFITVDRRLYPNIFRIYPGFWVTRLGDNNIRCYTNYVFKKQFIENNSELSSWFGEMDKHINGK